MAAVGGVVTMVDAAGHLLPIEDVADLKTFVGQLHQALNTALAPRWLPPR